MHQLFEIPELIRLVFTPNTRKSTLCAVACTSRALQEPALDALWYELDTIGPLVSLLGVRMGDYYYVRRFWSFLAKFAMGLKAAGCHPFATRRNAQSDLQKTCGRRFKNITTALEDLVSTRPISS